MKTTILKAAVLSVLLLQAACGGKATSTSTGTSLILKGHYNGNNLFVKNPMGPGGLGFCVNEVLINGNRTSDEITSENIEIDLKASGVREGHEITVEIKHYKDCQPTILNPEVLN